MTSDLKHKEFDRIAGELVMYCIELAIDGDRASVVLRNACLY